MRFAPRFAVVCCLACFIGSPVSLRAEEGRLFPREVFVGDSAELTFRCPALAPVLEEGLSLTVGSDAVPTSGDLDITSVSALKTGGVASVTVAFVPWVTGTVSFPPLAIQGVSVSPPSVRIASIADKTGTTSLKPERSPLLVPGTTWLLYGLIAVSLAAIALAAFIAIRVRAFLFAAGDRMNVRNRTRILARSLKTLERAADSMDGARWYCAYARALRLYLGACFAGDFDAYLPLTGTEISSSADGLFSARVAALFSDIDAIRFGGAAPDGDELPSTPEKAVFLNRARELSTDIEAWLLEQAAETRNADALATNADARAADAPALRGGDDAGL